MSGVFSMTNIEDSTARTDYLDEEERGCEDKSVQADSQDAEAETKALKAQIAELQEEIRRLKAGDLRLSDTESTESEDDQEDPSLQRRIYKLQHGHEKHHHLDLDNIAQTPDDPVLSLKYKILERAENNPSRCLFKSRNSDMSRSGDSKY